MAATNRINEQIAREARANLSADSDETTGSDGGSTGDSYQEPPVLDLKPGERPALSSLEAGLWMKMDGAEQKLKRSGNVITNDLLDRYIRNLVCKLARPFCNDIRVYVVRVPYFNASMAPNGVMQVWTGLLLRVKNEAQLAAILSHEIAHFVRRHSLQRFRNTRDSLNALTFLNFATLGLAAPVSVLASIGVAGGLSAFSRDQEREADDKGQQLMFQQGYDPRAAPAVWRRILKEKNAGDDDSPWEFFATHPSSEDRLATMKKQALKMTETAHKTFADDGAFDRILKPWRARFLHDEVRLRRYPKSEAMIKTLIDDGVGAGELHYFLGELYRLRNAKDDRARALQAYQIAQKNGGAPAELHRSMGLLHRRNGEKEEAAAAFRRYIQAKPEADDRKMIEWMMREGN